MDFNLAPVFEFNLIGNSRRRGNQRLAVFALQAFLHDFGMEHTEEAAAKTKAQSLRGFWLINQRGIVEAQLL